MQLKQTNTLRSVFEQGYAETRHFGAQGLTLDYLFLAILKQEGGHASYLLRKLLKEWEIYQIKIRIENDLKRAQADAVSMNPVLLPSVKESEGSILIRLAEETDDPRHNLLNTAHLLMAIVKDRSSICGQVLAMYNVNSETLSEFVRELPPNEDYYEDMKILDEMSADREAEHYFTQFKPRPQAETESEPAMPVRKERKSPSSDPLIRFGVDLTLAAREGRLDPVIGRDEEIERLVQILGRRKKNNPVLIGEPGVGKSAIVEGLALRIVDNDVPVALRDKRVFALDVASLVAGTKYRGEFEERINTLLGELRKTNNVILFIDEIHTIVGAGSTQGSLDTANILKPVLARGELQCIGATTLREFRENIETDGALERRFQKIIVEQPSPEQTLAVLHNIKRQYEEHHGVRYTDAALTACVELTQRYVADRFFPDKAIDVMDEAGSRAHVKKIGDAMPAGAIQLEERIEKLVRDKKKAMQSRDYEHASVLRGSELELRSRLRAMLSAWTTEMSASAVVIDEQQISEVVASMTGIPLARMSQGEQQRLKDLYGYFSSVVVGQDEAVRKVTRAIQRSRVGLKDPNRPIGVFMFVGPTGVGKTHMAKELAMHLFDSEEALVRVDMSEYSEKHNVSRLIGSPPGYVGYGEGGQLTEKVRRRPYCVVLFDEIEKAHPDIFNTLLQVLDDGHLTDGQGRKVDFKNTIIILTTNLGTRDIAKAANTGFNLGANNESSYQRMKDQVSSELKQQFRPEFLNRLDDIIVFKQLTEPQVRQIVDLDVKQLNDRLFDRHMSLELTDAAKDLLAQKGFDPLLGARPLRRVIQRDIEDAISEKILMGDLEDGQRVIVDAEGEGILGEFTFKGEEFEEPAAADKPAEDGAATDGETPADATPATEPAESAPADSGDAPQE